MIDLHSHILHELDDGARSLEDALVIARLAVEDGVRTMAATPHGRSTVNISSRYSVVLLHERLEALRAALTAEKIPLEVVAGTEIYAEPGALERLQAGELLTYGASRAVLIEFPLAISAEAAGQFIFAFQLAGYRVVVAHPERYRFAQHDPNALIPLIERGALMQLTADALLGIQGGRMRRMAESMLRHGLVQILATDTHGPHLRRMPNMAAARDLISEMVDAVTAEALAQSNPAAVLADQPVSPPAPEPLRRWFGVW
jgi:protein-tyrosine phosphatase